MADEPTTNAPRVISLKKRSRGPGRGCLLVRLLGGVVPVPTHVPGHGQTVPCLGAACVYCRIKLPPSTVHLAPVLYLRGKENESDTDEPDRWERAALMLAQPTAATVGEFRRGRVLRFDHVSNRRSDMSEVAEPPGPFSEEPFDVAEALRARSVTVAPSAEELVKNARFQPGQEVLLTGTYRVAHDALHAPTSRVVCVRGEQFPACVVCGSLAVFRLVIEFPHAAEHPLFSARAGGG